MSPRAHSVGIPVIQHYPTLIDISNVSVDLQDDESVSNTNFVFEDP